jgi:Stage II sporulation protein E (SpoIIE)/GAF domain
MLSKAGLARSRSRRRGRRGDNDLLAAAGAVFDRSLDHRETMRTIARTAVPRLADLCVIDLIRDDGLIGDTVAASVDEAAWGQLERIRGEQPLDPAGAHPVARALRSGEAVVIEDLADPSEIEQVAQSDEHRRFIAKVGYRSGVVMPLLARGRLLGALSFLYVGEDRRYDDQDLPLMYDIADRAAMALDNARLFEERAHVAQTLQRSLLPEGLPELEGLTLAWAYQSALERAEVGGDFYDAFQTPEGHWLVVGDVCGKGTDAAAVTALVRHSVRALAFAWQSPAKVLAAVNEVMLGHGLGGRFATAVVAKLAVGRPSSTAGEAPVDAPGLAIAARLTVAGAGHPAPLLVGADGGARELPSPGMLLGVRSGEVSEDIQLDLEHGSTLVLYTDGLLDAGAPRRELTPAQLCERLAGAGARAPGETVEALRALALENGAGRLRDDIAIVAAQVK